MAKDINLHKQEFILSLFLLQVFREFMKNKQFAKILKIFFLYFFSTFPRFYHKFCLQMIFIMIMISYYSLEEPDVVVARIIRNFDFKIMI